VIDLGENRVSYRSGIPGILGTAFDRARTSERHFLNPHKANLAQIEKMPLRPPPSFSLLKRGDW